MIQEVTSTIKYLDLYIYIYKDQALDVFSPEALAQK